VPDCPTTKNSFMTLTGKFIDAESYQPIQGVSVSLVTASNSATGKGTTTNSSGNFSLSDTLAAPPNKLWITHVSYYPIEIDIPADGVVGTIDIEKNEATLPGIIVTGNKKNTNLLWLLAIGVIAAKASSSKKVGAFASASGRKETFLMNAAGGVLLLGFDTIKKIFEGIGFWNSKDDKAVEDEITNPNSAFSPLFYQNAPAGSLLITNAQAQQYLNTLTEAFGGFDDDEAQAIGVFKNFKTQSQVSYFAEYFKNNIWPAGADLLSWLQGSAWPNDRLSNTEVATIINYVDKLPKYKP